MLSNTIVKLSAVFLFATPAVLIGGEVYSILTGSTPLEGFLKIYSVLYIIPGKMTFSFTQEKLCTYSPVLSPILDSPSIDCQQSFLDSSLIDCHQNRHKHICLQPESRGEQAL